MRLRLEWRPFRFALRQPLRTSRAVLQERSGWLLRLKDVEGRCGWGEVAPLDPALRPVCETQLRSLAPSLTRQQLDLSLVHAAAPLAFGLGAALAELDGLVGERLPQGWLPPPPSALLLPAGGAMLEVLEQLLRTPRPDTPLTLKWKVATEPDEQEWSLLRALLERLPSDASLRLDANGGWDRSTAERWMRRLVEDPRLAWLEQPLAPQDHAGLQALAAIGPVALDESLDVRPSLRNSWDGWQVRRPLIEGDPRPLLMAMQKKQAPRVMISTAFETGIGRRWIDHLAALQLGGPTPVAPGLAPGWCPDDGLFSDDPHRVWDAASR